MLREGFFVTKNTKKRCIFLLGMLLFIYLAENAAFLFPGSPFFITYIFRPLLWLGLAYTVWNFPGVRPAGRLRLRSFLILLAFIFAVFHILFMLIAGLWDGFGKSPYSFTPWGIFWNLILVGSTLVGSGLARAYLLGALTTRRPFFVVILISLFFTVTSLPFSRLTSFRSFYDFVKYSGNFVLPTFSESLLTSYLAYLGGFLPALVYQSILQAFSWFCPILPNLGWMTKTLMGTIVPFLSLILLQHLYFMESRELKKTSFKEENPVAWVLTSTVSVLVIWFAVGIFPYYPSVIVTGSMEPMIKPGDVVLVKKVTSDEVQQGDVIHFRLDKIMVTHRVIGINGEKNRQFLTKGDNNDAPDDKLVEAAQVKGKVVKVVPKIGWFTLLIRSKGSILAM